MLLPARHALREYWEFCATPPASCSTPEDLVARLPDWVPTSAPTTVAGALRRAGLWSLEGPARRFDAEDWWFRHRFDVPILEPTAQVVLGLGGLATIADVWLNGERVLKSHSMFIAHEICVAPLAAGNELVICFRSLDHALKARRARPRWRAPMVENQQLRWFRTTLLGRTPGWSPAAAAVGPWREAWIECRGSGSLHAIRIHSTYSGGAGHIRLEARRTDLQGQIPATVMEVLHDGQVVASAPLESESEHISAVAAIPDPLLWWPHTHGTPQLYEIRLRPASDSSGTNILVAGRAGFRDIHLQRAEQGDFKLQVNGAYVFCRGACWTPVDAVQLHCGRENLRVQLQQFVAAGMNMIRVGGTMVPESDDFHSLCDELGILVWQDFMFANMDYPAEDVEFLADVREEARQLLMRASRHPSTAVLCGNSEVEQQAAMWGAPATLWHPPLFHQTLAEMSAELCPNVPYWPSSAHGGTFPHQNSAGSTSYYGVGAYLRPLSDLRLSGLQFATECLAFANVPEPELLDAISSTGNLRVHHPEWKRRVPRDLGAGWDFDDVRDHYLREVFGIDPLALRYADHDRYLDLSRRVSGELMRAAFEEWRRASSVTNGGLIWFLRDLWPGAGWGIIDAHGEPKQPWYELRRALQPRWISVHDQGLDGVVLNIGNERDHPFDATLKFAAYRDGRRQAVAAQTDIRVAGRSVQEIPVLAILGEFRDLTHAYRFGPRSVDVMTAHLVAPDGTEICSTIVPARPDLHLQPQSGVIESARAKQIGDSLFELTIRASAYARSVRIDAPGFRPEDQYFSMAPDSTCCLLLRSTTQAGSAPPRGRVAAVNATPISIETES